MTLVWSTETSSILIVVLTRVVLTPGSIYSINSKMQKLLYAVVYSADPTCKNTVKCFIEFE